MSLLDDVIAANRAVVDREDVPVPLVPEGKRVVVVTCSEIAGSRRTADMVSLMGLSASEVLLVAVAGPRVGSADGDVARSVLAGLAAGRGRGGEVFLVAHEDCHYLETDQEAIQGLLGGSSAATMAAVWGTCGESFVSARRLAITCAERLRASPMLPPGTPVHALVLNTGSGRFAVEEPGYGKLAAPGVLGAVSASSAMGGLGVMPSPMLQPSSAGGVAGPAGVGMFASGASSLMGPGPTPLLGAAGPGYAAGQVSLLAAPAPDFVIPGLQMPAVPQMPSVPGMPPMPVPPPPLVVPPPLPPSFPASPPRPSITSGSPLPPDLLRPPVPRPTWADTAEDDGTDDGSDEPPDEPPPPPPPRHPSAPPRPSGEDPFSRAERVLERLRRDRRRNG